MQRTQGRKEENASNPLAFLTAIPFELRQGLYYNVVVQIMGTTVTVRLDVEMERLVERVARLRKQSKSQVIRDAITALAKQEAPPAGSKPHEAIAHLIGCVRGGPSDLSARTGEKFRRLLLERERRRK